MDYIPGDAIKRDPERENCAVLTIAAQTANSIHNCYSVFESFEDNAAQE